MYLLGKSRENFQISQKWDLKSQKPSANPENIYNIHYIYILYKSSPIHPQAKHLKCLIVTYRTLCWQWCNLFWKQSNIDMEYINLSGDNDDLTPNNLGQTQSNTGYNVVLALKRDINIKKNPYMGFSTFIKLEQYNSKSIYRRTI